MNDLEKHFKDKLLRVSSGAFDGVYCDRFKRFKLDASTQVGDITVISSETRHNSNIFEKVTSFS